MSDLSASCTPRDGDGNREDVRVWDGSRIGVRVSRHRDIRPGVRLDARDVIRDGIGISVRDGLRVERKARP